MLGEDLAPRGLGGTLTVDVGGRRRFAAGSPGRTGDGGGARLLLLQASLIAWLMTLLRRAGRAAEDAMVARAAAERVAAILAARRADRREQLRQMHDHVLTTLLMVGIGSIDSRSAALREQAAHGLEVFENLGDAPPTVTGAGGLERRLHDVVAAAGAGLNVSVSVPDLDLPVERAVSVASCVALRGFAAGRSPVRFSEDLDVLANMAARAGNLAACVRGVQQLGFTAAPAATTGITHRYVRGETVIDLVAPDHLPPAMRLTTTPPGRRAARCPWPAAGRRCSGPG